MVFVLNHMKLETVPLKILLQQQTSVVQTVRIHQTQYSRKIVNIQYIPLSVLCSKQNNQNSKRPFLFLKKIVGNTETNSVSFNFLLFNSRSLNNKVDNAGGGGGGGGIGYQVADTGPTILHFRLL